MDESLYDEFGNYIGPELSESEEVLSTECKSFVSCPACSSSTAALTMISCISQASLDIRFAVCAQVMSR